MIPRFEPHKALEVLQRDKVTIMQGVPTMYVALLQDPAHKDYDVSTPAARGLGRRQRCRSRCCVGSRRSSASILLEGYGLSETSPVASVQPRRPRAQGRQHRHPGPRRRDASDRRRLERHRRTARSARSRSRARTS
ncbi:MAG: AMP-binding protein [Candidatus Nanopelagicales bacterium]